MIRVRQGMRIRLQFGYYVSFHRFKSIFLANKKVFFGVNSLLLT